MLGVAPAYAASQVTFSYTGAEQQYTAPAGICSIQVDAYGAQGKNGSGGAPGGLGARAQATITVTPGETLYVYVGGRITGYNGGGGGNGGSPANGIGGGASDVRQGGNGTTNRVVVAGGGGGGGGYIGGSGGAGGAIGGTGETGFGNPGGSGGGNGGGGNAGIGESAGVIGSDFYGGDGGASLSVNKSGGGGGGGGWGGGGGGAGGVNGGGGGGGGGSLAAGGTITDGFWSGDGQVILTPVNCVPASVTFDGNGADGGSMSNQTSSVEASLTTNAFTRTGYTFAGWNTLADGSGMPYADGAIYDFSADMTLSAQWIVPPPAAFGKTSPAEAATNQPTNIVLNWAASTGATGYEYCIDQVAGSTCDTSWQSIGNVLTISQGGLPAGSDFYWQVRASNAAPSAVEADGGTWWTFSTIPACSTITVANNADSGAGTLRQAIADACTGETINFSNALSGQTIRLASTLTLDKDVTIDGSALASPVIISGDSDGDGNGDVRPFIVNSGIAATLDSLIVTKGLAPSGGGLSSDGGYVTIKNSIFSYNNGDVGINDGGGVRVWGGTLTIDNSVFEYNYARSGGGVLFGGGGTLTVTNSAFSNNTVYSGGGGLKHWANGSQMTLTNSTFTGNQSAGTGGGFLIGAGATGIIANSTFYNNTSSSNGGGIAITGDWTGTAALTIKNVTLSANSAPSGGGIYNAGFMYYYNVISANSPTGGDCVNANTIGGNANNLIEDGTCYSALSGDPALSALASNGGLTQTMALQTASPALGAGDAATCAAAPVSNLDQRGQARPQGNAVCDIGAYESSNLAIHTVTFNGNSADGGSMSNQTNSSAANLTTNAFTRTGYAFSGWNTASNGSGINYADGESYDFSADLTLYAKWTVNQYTISFIENGGSAVTDITDDYGANVSTPTDPTKTGYTFGGWYSDAGLTSAYTFSTMPLGGVTLYAKWTINQYTISFIENGGSAVADITDDYGANVSTPTDPTKTGYTFGGWYSDAGLTSAYTFSTMPLDGVTLYAKWTINQYTVTYNGNGNTGGSAPVDASSPYNYNSTVTTLGNTGSLVKTGYAFAGWNTQADGLGTDYGATFTLGAANEILYAKWTADNVAPAVSSITRADANPTAAASVNFTATFSEPVTGVDIADFKLNNALATGASIANVTPVSSTVYTVTVNTNQNGELRLDVPATATIADLAANPLTAPYSGGEAYTVNKGNAPTTPVLRSPLNNALVTNTPTLDWNDSSQVMALAINPWSYEVNITALGGYNETFNTAGNIADPLLGLGDSSLTIPALSALPSNTTFYWKVRAYNNQGQYSAWSLTRSFRTKLDTPALNLPTDGSILNNKRPTFEWDSVDGASSYTVQIFKKNAATNAFTVLANSGFVKAPNNTYTPMIDLLPNTEYQWRVKANGTNAGNYSAQISFTTSVNPPKTPALFTPQTNTIAAASGGQVLDWNPIAAVVSTNPLLNFPAAGSYELQYANNSSFTGVTVTSVITDSATTSASIVTLPGRTYYWRVRAWSGASGAGNHSAWSAARMVRIKFEAPTLIAPVDGATGASRSAPTFTWSSGNALWTSYTIQLATTPPTATSFSVVKSFTVLAPTETYTAALIGTKQLLANKTYYWRVRINGAYLPIFSSTKQSFTTAP
ncbi:MAG: hypothetical protein Fur002_22250 [Anaerolineales bacterium]